MNDVPHIGHAYTTIVADILARWYRFTGKNVFFLTGTDEHGKKVLECAEKCGKKPKEFTDGVVKSFKELWKTLNISNDFFVRTTDPKHKEIVKLITEKINKNGDIYKGKYEGWYCVPDETFWTELQLKDGKCPECGREVERVEEESYFFKLSKYQDKLLELYEKNPNFISPVNRKREIINRVKEGLKDLSITRRKESLSWGIEFPIDKNHVIYVWFDALSNYLTAIDYPRHGKWWPANIHIMAKEILWFHAVIWPAMLMSLGEEQPEKVFAHGWLTVDGNKMSKSVGNIVDPVAISHKYSADALRFYLIREISLGDDGDFSERALVDKINNEIIANYGNLFYRITSFIEKNFGTVPEGKLGADEKKFEKRINNAVAKVEKRFERTEIREALDDILTISSELNKYFQDKKPWETKDGSVLYFAVNALHTITCLLHSFMPETCGKALDLLGVELDYNKLGKFNVKAGSAIKSGILFDKVEFVEEKSSPKLVVATIEDVKEHEDADKLYVLQIDCGDKRQIVSSLKDYYTADELLGKKIIVVSNLEKARFRGVDSNGMLLACDNEKATLLTSDAENGTVVLDGNGMVDFKTFSKMKLIIEGNELVIRKNGKKIKLKAGGALVRPISDVKDGTKVD